MGEDKGRWSEVQGFLLLLIRRGLDIHSTTVSSPHINVHIRIQMPINSTHQTVTINHVQKVEFS